VRLYFLPAVISLVVAALVVWSGYRYSIGAIRDASSRPYRLIDQLVGESGHAHDLLYGLIEAPIFPAPELWGGIGQTIAHHQEAHTTYLLGETRARGGFWAFFPIAFVVKTPIPFILFAVIGAAAMLRVAWIERDWVRAAPFLSAAAVMLAAMPSGVNVGLRHILAIFPMSCLVAAFGVCCLVRSAAWQQRTVRWISLGLLVWFGISSFQPHPVYLTYFNGLAGAHPENILADSDLDWGQDVGRLARELKKRKIDGVHLGLFTRADLDHFDWPRNTIMLEDGVPATGWVAASIYHIKVSKKFAWLESYEPIDTVGRSIRLYRIPAAC
jgi:hypothetical protein